MTKTLSSRRIPSPTLRTARVARVESQTVGAGHVAPGYLMTAVNANVIPVQASVEIVMATGMSSTYSASGLDLAFERRRCNFRLKQRIHRFH
jgi:hypothetical protein